MRKLIIRPFNAAIDNGQNHSVTKAMSNDDDDDDYDDWSLSLSPWIIMNSVSVEGYCSFSPMQCHSNPKSNQSDSIHHFYFCSLDRYCFAIPSHLIALSLFDSFFSFFTLCRWIIILHFERQRPREKEAVR